MSRTRTIEIVLPNGEPTGIKYAHIRNRSIRATYIPRARLSDARSIDKLRGVGIYLLISDPEHHSKPVVYIGEAERVFARIMQHNIPNNAYWNYAIAITSEQSHFTKTHAKFLERICYDKIDLANRSIIVNDTTPTKPHVQESTEAECYDDFELIELLVATLTRTNIFQSLVGNNLENTSAKHRKSFNTNQKIYKIKGRGAEALGKYTQDGFIVFAGARCAKKMSASYEKGNPKRRALLIKDGILVDKGHYLELKEDYAFPSPSAASDVVLAMSSNGWDVWKLDDGRTLSQVERSK